MIKDVRRYQKPPKQGKLGLSCPDCGSKRTRRNGFSPGRKGKAPRAVCNDCGCTFNYKINAVDAAARKLGLNPKFLFY